MSGPEPGSGVDVASRISAEIAAIQRESYGEGVDSIQTHIFDDMVVCVLDVQLLPLERTLLEHDRGVDSIRPIRKEFQESIAATFSATVEHMTGRRGGCLPQRDAHRSDVQRGVLRLAPRP